MINKKQQIWIAAFLSLALLVTPIVVMAEGGSGLVRVGYTLTDETGSLAANQETYNVYRGLDLSLTDLSFDLNNGVRVKADLSRFTLNNRNLTASLSKAGLFNITLHNDQYRRIYDIDGNNFTRRRTSSMQLSVRPTQRVELFGGYSVVSKKGISNDNLVETADLTKVDYDHTSINLGANVTNTNSSLRVQYRRYNLEDNLFASGATDRKTDEVRVSGSARLPQYKWFTLSGGYYYRTDELTFDSSKIKTNLGWGATKLYLPYSLTMNYKIMLARTDRTTTSRLTDNVNNTISIGRSWRGKYGIQVGYENRIAFDDVDRTESDGFLFNGWAKLNQRLFVRALVTTRGNDVVSGATLIGDESVTNHKVTIKYVSPSWGDLSVQWSGQIRTNEADLAVRDTLLNSDIGSKVDYNVITTALNLKFPEYGRVNLSHSYYLGTFENNSVSTNYEFSDNIFRASLYPNAYGNLQVNASGSYYRSRRDQDIEKFQISVTSEYKFLSDHVFGVTYNVFNFDEFIVANNYYTGNIVDIYVTKGIEF